MMNNVLRVHGVSNCSEARLHSISFLKQCTDISEDGATTHTHYVNNVRVMVVKSNRGQPVGVSRRF